MEFRHLRYFLALAEELHFGRAAQRLSISQPPLSLNIQQLEASVGAQLFTRNSRGVQLTAAGQAFVPAARALLAQASDAAREAREVARRHGADCAVAIGGGSTTGLGKAIALRTGADHVVVPTTYAGSEMTDILGETAAGEKVTCDILALWGERGTVEKMFKPLDLWQAQCAGRVSGQALPAGHFIPEELPEQTVKALADFMR